MNDLQNPFIDFYNRHGIIPVAQDISNLEQHFQRRAALYRHCGIPSQLITGRSVLEIGPGTGHNAVYTNALKPENYVLVDGAKQSVKTLKEIFEKTFSDTSNCRVIESSLEDLVLDEVFDVVLCEGAIPFQKEPTRFLRTISEFVKPGGLLLITCADSVSYFSEILRRMMGLLVLKDRLDADIKFKLEILRPIFADHLKNLKGMSRPVDDWIYDNILQPILGRPLSIEQAIMSLDDDFDVYGSSPHIFADWRWYKDIHGEQQCYNTSALDVFRSNVHNFLDYRYVFDPIAPEKGVEIASLCHRVFESSIHLQNNGLEPPVLKQVSEDLELLVKRISGFSKNTGHAIEEFNKKLGAYLNGDTFSVDQMPNFSLWFGRSQQYLSFIRKP